MTRTKVTPHWQQDAEGNLYSPTGRKVKANSVEGGGTLAPAPDHSLIGVQVGDDGTHTPEPIDMAEVIARRVNARSFIAPFETVADLAARTPVAGLQTYSLFHTGSTDSHGVHVIGRSGEVGEFTGRKRFIVPSGGDGSLAWEIIDESPGTIFVEKVGGAHPTKSASYNTGAINDTILSAKSDKKLVACGVGEFAINDSILFFQCSGMSFVGRGSHETGIATAFRWEGPNDVPAIIMENTRGAQLHNFLIKLAAQGTYPLYCGIQLLWSGGSVATTANILSDITVNGGFGYCAYGVRIEKTELAADSNNSEHLLYHVRCGSIGNANGVYAHSSGFYNSQGQAKAITYFKCMAQGINDPTQPAKVMNHGYYGLGTLNWIQGNIQRAQTANFEITGVNDGVNIQGLNTEHSKRLLIANHTVAQNISVKDTRMSCLGLHADGEVIQFSGGALKLENVRISDATGECTIALGNINAVTHLDLKACTIESTVHPVKPLAGSATTWNTDGIASGGTEGVGRATFWPNRVRPPARSIETLPIVYQTQLPGGYLRPSSPQDREPFWDKYLQSLIVWDADAAAWLNPDGTAAAAAFDPTVDGTLAGAWDFESGVTEAAGLITAVTPKHGTAVGLTCSTNMVLRDWYPGRKEAKATDTNAYLTATFGSPIAQPCEFYVCGSYQHAVGSIFGSGDGALKAEVIASAYLSVNAGTALTSAAATSPTEARPFVGRWTFDGASSSFRVRIYGRSTEFTISGDAGDTDGNTELRIGAVSGNGNLMAFSKILYYSTAPANKTRVFQWLREWGAVD